jgi:hypothetical protein
MQMDVEYPEVIYRYQQQYEFYLRYQVLEVMFADLSKEEKYEVGI